MERKEFLSVLEFPDSYCPSQQLARRMILNQVIHPRRDPQAQVQVRLVEPGLLLVRSPTPKLMVHTRCIPTADRRFSERILRMEATITNGLLIIY